MELVQKTRLGKQERWERELIHRTGYTHLLDGRSVTREYRQTYYLHLMGAGDEERLVKRAMRFLRLHRNLICVSYIIEGTPRIMLEVSRVMPLRRLILEDAKNSRRQSGKSFIGVARRGEHWVAQAFGAKTGKRSCYIGMYETEVEAAYAHDIYCVKHGMIHAPLNFKEMWYERGTKS